MALDINKQVNTFFGALGRNSAYGLRLLVNAAEKIDEDRDWDAAAAIFAKAKAMDDKRIGATITNSFKLILRTRFGDRLNMVADKTAKHGVKFEMKWKVGEHVVQSNYWAYVHECLKAGKGYADAEMLKTLKGLNVEEVAQKEYDTAAAAKPAYKKLKEEGINLSSYINALVALQKAESVFNTPVVKVELIDKDDVIIPIDKVA